MVLLILYILTLVITYFVYRKTLLFIDKTNERKRHRDLIDFGGEGIIFLMIVSMIPVVNIVLAIIMYSVVRIEESEEDFTDEILRKFFFLKKKAE